MAFSKKTRLAAKKRSAFRCCICHKPFVEVHHIIPEEQGGADTLDNAAPLCASCHDLYGGNPDKRKTLREMRDDWWDVIAQRESRIASGRGHDQLSVIEENESHKGQLRSKSAFIFHRVFANEGFDVAANHLFELVKSTQKLSPGQRRILILSIDGHRNEAGGFDADMYHLQMYFMLGFLCDFVTEIAIPLVHARNPHPQRNDVPDELTIIHRLNQEALSEIIDKHEDFAIWLADKHKWLKTGRE